MALLATPHDEPRPAIRRAVLIANPASRRGGRLHAAAHAALRREGVDCALLLTQRPGHAAEMAATHAGGMDAVFVLGGDGTVMEVAGALAGRRVPIGVLAGGTGNLLARALGIPLRLSRAVPALLNGDRLRIDLGRLPDGRSFAVAAGMGIDARMVRDTPVWLKRRLGVLAYTLIATRGAIGTVLRRDFFAVRLTVDGMVHERPCAALAMIANFGAVLEDRITFGPGIASDDGVLDACIYSPRGLWDALVIMWRMLRKDFRSDERVLYLRGRAIELVASRPEMVQADGELLSMDGRLEARVEPLAAELLVPREQ